MGLLEYCLQTAPSESAAARKTKAAEVVMELDLENEAKEGRVSVGYLYWGGMLRNVA